MVISMKTLTKLLIASIMAFFDSLTAHAIVPIIPVWVIYIYAVPTELITIHFFDKIIRILRRWL